MEVFITYYSKIFHLYIYSHLIRYNPWYNPMQILDTYNLYLNYCLAYASIIFIQSKMTRGIKLQFISIMVEHTKAKSTQSIYFLRILTRRYITSTFGYAQIQRINNETSEYLQHLGLHPKIAERLASLMLIRCPVCVQYIQLNIREINNITRRMRRLEKNLQ